ncbi:transglutaminase domain-containing protein [bacterium]|nr:transglutaminase domain-containing protein [bacterium]
MCSTVPASHDFVSEQKKIDALILSGEFTAATQIITNYLEQGDLTGSERARYLFEIERLNRIRKDFTVGRAEVLEYIKRYYPQVSDSNMAVWEAAKALEVMTIDGQDLYFNRAARNLFRIDPEMKQVWNTQHPDAEITSGSGAKLDLDLHNAAVIQDAIASGDMYVKPKRLRIKQSIVVNANVVPAGEIIKCWIPYPRLIPGRQQDIEFIQSQPETHQLAPEAALQRTIYFEKLAVADQVTLFSTEYDFTSHAVYREIDPDRVTKLQSLESLEANLQEESPHIVFTPALQKLSQAIIGDEQNPYLKARLLFAWVDEHTPWASAREYSTIRCIPEYAFENGHGDCGIQTLLFITLCRMNGIPARWQSGWELQPPNDSMHDWGMIYFEPYGWVPMDVTYGLRQSEDVNLQWFYLSGMDSYRIIFNDAYSKSFIPTKSHIRSETIDSQRGEVEWSGGNLYFDQWSWDFEWEILE